MLNGRYQGLARFQTETGWKRELAIWHKPRPFGPGQRFAGAERVSQYLPNNS